MPDTRKPFHVIYEAEWNDIVCVDYPLTPEKYVTESIQPLVNSHVDTLFYNLCSSDAYCCGLEHGEILCDAFDKLGDAWVWRYRENVKKLLEADANPPAIACEYGHRLGLKVLPVVRMNDMHDMFYKYEVSRYKLENPHLLLGHGSYIDWEKGARGHPDRKSIESFTWGMFDYAHEQVREHRFAIIDEFITRWDNDGVSLDFDRDPWLFREQGDAQNAALITDLVRRVRRRLDALAAERGRAQYLHVRVIPPIDTCVERGMDVRTWVREGLVDAITPGCGYITISQDISPWLKLVEGSPCWIYPASNHWKKLEVTRAWAKRMWRRGAHGLYLFNWGHLLYGHDRSTPPGSERLGTVWYDELHPDYYRILHEMGEPKTLAFRDCDYSFESIPHERTNGETGLNQRESRGLHDITLPLEWTKGRHTLSFEFADDLDAARARALSPRVALHLKVHNYTAPDEFDVLLNGQLLPESSRTTRAQFIMDNWTWITYPLPLDELEPGANELMFDVRKTNEQMEACPRLDNLEIRVRYG
ncbi:MAG: hypothetical protein CMJ18_00565 [Phycisphaeraceae bacterium]|nr:hypothetical protein [Phycisphaeraceae bacterium]